MAKADLGTKRTCPNCGAKYYDLNKVPPICPKCGTKFELAPAKTRPTEAAEKPKEVVVDEPAEKVGAEVISLEEADAEATGGKKNETPTAIDSDEDEDLEVSDDDDDPFLGDDDDDDDDDDVADIVPAVDDDDSST